MRALPLGLMLTLALDWTALPLPAATKTWTGNANSFWSEPTNWSPPGAPQDGDSLVFPPSSATYTSQNDLTNPRIFSILLEGGGYNLTGNAIRLDSDLTDNHSTSAANRLSFRINFTGAGSVNVVGTQEGSLLEIHEQLRMSGSEPLTLFVDAFDAGGDPGYLTLRDAIVSSGAVVKRGSGVLYFRNGNPNVFSGGMHVLEGTVHLLGNRSVPTEPGTGRLVIGSNGISQATVYVGATPWAGQVSIEVNNSHLEFQYDTAITYLKLREGAIVDGPGSLTIYGAVESISDVFTPVINLPFNIYPAFTGFNIHGANYSGIDIQTSIGGPGGISKSGTSALVLQRSNSFAGNITVYGGILDAHGASALGGGTNVTVHGTASLTLRNAGVTGKTLGVFTREQIVPGLFGTILTSFGASSWSGPVILHTNLAILSGDMTFSGPISGSGGMILLNGTSIFSGTEANTFTGATLVRNPLLLLNKSSGVAAFGGPLIVGDGNGSLNEARWLQNYQRVGADVTLFADGLVNLNDHADDFGPVTFNAGAIFTGTGELGIYGLVMVNPSIDAATIDGRLGLPPGAHEFRVNDGSALPDLRINATIVGAGHLRKTGAGQMWLAASNSYTGLTFVDQGTLSALNAFALGASSAGTTVNEGATLDLSAISSTMPEPLALRGMGDGGNGALNVFGIATLRNPFPSIYAAIDLTTNTTIRVGPGSLLTVDGFISGIGTLTKIGAGTLLFANANANTYSGDTIIADGTLDMAKPNNNIAVPGALIVGPAPFNSSALVRWSQTGGMNANSIATANAGSMLDLNGFNQTLARVNLNDGADVQTGAGTLSFPVGGSLNVGSLNMLGSHASSSFSGNIGLPANATLTFAVNPYASHPPFDFNPELDVSASIAAPVENPNFERAGLTKNGMGTLRLSGNNSYRGWTDVAEGTLVTASSVALGAAFFATGTYVFNSARLALEGSLNVESEVLVLNSTAMPALESLSGESYWSGPVILNRHSSVGARASSLLQLAGVISGAANFTKLGAGTLRFGGGAHNTYSGETFVNEGVLLMSKPTAVTSIPGSLNIGTPAGVSATAANLTSYQVIGNIFVNRGGLLNLNGQVENVDHLWLSEGGDVQTTTGVLFLKTGGSIQVFPGAATDPSTIAGNLEVDAGTHAINVAASTSLMAGPNLDITAAITSSGGAISLQKNGTGRLRLAGQNTYTGEAVVNAGILQVDGIQSASEVLVHGGARLMGTGRTGPVTFVSPSGIVAPGASTANLDVGHFNLSAVGGILQMELNGPTPGSGYDRLTVHGLVDLTGMTLQASINFASAINDQFMIVGNDLSEEITGEFIGLPEGGNVRFGDHIFQISYFGGDGNDVVLTKTGDVYRPALTIERVAPTSVRLLWPTNDPAFHLQFSTNLSAASWAAASPLPAVNGTNNVVTNATGDTRKFYRLFKP